MSDSLFIFKKHLKYLMLLCSFALCAHVAKVGGDFMALHRFLVPLLPLLVVLCSTTVPVQFSVEVKSFDKVKKNFNTALLVTTLILGCSAFFIHRHANRIGSTAGVDSIGWLRQFSEQCAQTGKFIKDTTDPNIKLATTAAGALPFYAERYTVDLLGLNDEWIAHQVPAKGHRPGHTKSAPFHYPIKKGVDYLIYHPTFTKHRPRVIRKYAKALEPLGYRWKSYKVPHLQPTWWSVWHKEAVKPHQ